MLIEKNWRLASSVLAASIKLITDALYNKYSVYHSLKENRKLCAITIKYLLILIK